MQSIPPPLSVLVSISSLFSPSLGISKQPYVSTSLLRRTRPMGSVPHPDSPPQKVSLTRFSPPPPPLTSSSLSSPALGGLEDPPELLGSANQSFVSASSSLWRRPLPSKIPRWRLFASKRKPPSFLIHPRRTG